MIEIMDALKLIDERITPCSRTQMVGLFEAQDKILAQDIICRRSLPLFNNSAMDGYGVRLSDSGKSVECGGTIFAGDMPNMQAKDGIAIKIMTGAPTNESIEAVVPFEDTKVIDGKIILPSNIKPMANIRLCGEEVCLGDTLIQKGEKLTPSHIGLLASQGIMSVLVSSKPRVGIISSGSEIKEPWEAASDFSIYNSNAPMLYSYCASLDCEVEYIKLMADNYEDTKEFIARLGGYDLLLTSGGISMGEADFMLKALVANGFVSLFEKVNIKPGKPTVLGMLGKTVVLALPGNPLATAVNFYLFGRVIIAKLKAQKPIWPTVVKLCNANEFKIKNARANQILGTIKNGEFEAYNGGKYGSGMLSPLANSSAFIILNAGTGVVPKGALLNVVPIDIRASDTLEELISYA